MGGKREPLAEPGVLKNLRILKMFPYYRKVGKETLTTEELFLGTVIDYQPGGDSAGSKRKFSGSIPLGKGCYRVLFDAGHMVDMSPDEILECARLFQQQRQIHGQPERGSQIILSKTDSSPEVNEQRGAQLLFATSNAPLDKAQLRRLDIERVDHWRAQRILDPKLTTPKPKGYMAEKHWPFWWDKNGAVKSPVKRAVTYDSLHAKENGPDNAILPESSPQAPPGQRASPVMTPMRSMGRPSPLSYNARGFSDLDLPASLGLRDRQSSVDSFSMPYASLPMPAGLKDQGRQFSIETTTSILSVQSFDSGPPQSLTPTYPARKHMSIMNSPAESMHGTPLQAKMNEVYDQIDDYMMDSKSPQRMPSLRPRMLNSRQLSVGSISSPGPVFPQHGSFVGPAASPGPMQPDLVVPPPAAVRGPPSIPAWTPSRKVSAQCSESGASKPESSDKDKTPVRKTRKKEIPQAAYKKDARELQNEAREAAGLPPLPNEESDAYAGSYAAESPESSWPQQRGAAPQPPRPYLMERVPSAGYWDGMAANPPARAMPPRPGGVLRRPSMSRGLSVTFSDPPGQVVGGRSPEQTKKMPPVAYPPRGHGAPYHMHAYPGYGGQGWRSPGSTPQSTEQLSAPGVQAWLTGGSGGPDPPPYSMDRQWGPPPNGYPPMPRHEPPMRMDPTKRGASAPSAMSRSASRGYAEQYPPFGWAPPPPPPSTFSGRGGRRVGPDRFGVGGMIPDQRSGGVYPGFERDWEVYPSPHYDQGSLPPSAMNHGKRSVTVPVGQPDFMRRWQEMGKSNNERPSRKQAAGQRKQAEVFRRRRLVHFGQPHPDVIEGVKTYSRHTLFLLGSHKSDVSAVSGNKATGCDSILFDQPLDVSARKDDVAMLKYTCSSKGGGVALYVSHVKNLPVRVFRRTNMKTRSYRYDGLYTVIAMFDDRGCPRSELPSESSEQVEFLLRRNPGVVRDSNGTIVVESSRCFNRVGIDDLWAMIKGHGTAGTGSLDQPRMDRKSKSSAPEPEPCASNSPFTEKDSSAQARKTTGQRFKKSADPSRPARPAALTNRSRTTSAEVSMVHIRYYINEGEGEEHDDLDESSFDERKRRKVQHDHVSQLSPKTMSSAIDQFLKNPDIPHPAMGNAKMSYQKAKVTFPEDHMHPR